MVLIIFFFLSIKIYSYLQCSTGKGELSKIYTPEDISATRIKFLFQAWKPENLSLFLYFKIIYFEKKIIHILCSMGFFF